jgi:tetratricopeptide (TPR) repeat protein
MRIFTLLFLACILSYTAPAQIDLSATQWQEDLKFLQKKVHDDYPFLFKKVTKEKFDTEVEQLYAAIPNLEEHEIIVGLSRIVALFEYGHTAMGLSGWYDRAPVKFHQMPYNLYWYNDGIHVQGVHKDYEKALGAKVLKVAGVPVEKAAQMVRPVMSVENDQYFKAFALTYLGTPEILHAQGVTATLQETITLTLEKEGKTFELTFKPVSAERFPGQYSHIQEEGDWLDARDNTGETPLYLKNLDRIYFYEYLPEQKAVYIRHSQIQDDDQQAIPEFYAEVFDFIAKNEVEKMILDVRLNGGGNNYKNKPIVTGIIETEKINKPGHLFVILGRRTYSACQNLVNELDNYTNAVFVGEPTAENINFYGDNRREVLPNSQIPVFLSFAWWQDKPQWENDDWLAPHLAVDMSFEEYRTNQDPVLQVALDFNSENFVLDPMAYFTGLYMAGKMEQLEKEAVRMVNDPMYSFFNFESEFNNVGYNLLGRNQTEPAIYVFTVNTKLFPDSANTWDSLGEANWKAGKIDEAIKYYNKAIKMDPEGSVGDNARAMLKKIKGNH